MATKSFALNTEPHVAAIGDTELLFQPEVMGDDFMDGYVGLRDAQQAIGVDIDNLESLDSQAIRNIAVALREFLARLMLPESAELITRLQVSQAGKTLDTFTDRAQAEAFAATVEGDTRITYVLRLPDRVLTELMEWTVELYSGGKRPPTSSSGSARQSRRSGTRGTGVSPSRVSTPTPGPSGG
ncbi:hypothetical protein ACIPQH_25345 [Streptomyces rubiginosohelvolus]|uniref:hypothetical protein n=1 Tax=Streptomyces rubiginosohelvolus TaxID=67362 RepID=UPI0038192FC1